MECFLRPIRLDSRRDSPVQERRCVSFVSYPAYINSTMNDADAQWFLFCSSCKRRARSSGQSTPSSRMRTPSLRRTAGSLTSPSAFANLTSIYRTSWSISAHDSAFVIALGLESRICFWTPTRGQCDAVMGRQVREGVPGAAEGE